jgi:acyl carrier protein
MPSVQDVIGLLRDTLQLGERARGFSDATPLLGHVPELDSLAVVNVLTAMEERFGVTVADDEISADTFETVGTLHSFLLRKLDS